MKPLKVVFTFAIICMLSPLASAEDGDSLSQANAQRFEPSHRWTCFCSCDTDAGVSIPVVTDGRCVLPDDNGNRCVFSYFPPLSGTTSSCESVLIPD